MALGVCQRIINADAAGFGKLRWSRMHANGFRGKRKKKKGLAARKNYLFDIALSSGLEQMHGTRVAEENAPVHGWKEVD